MSAIIVDNGQILLVRRGHEPNKGLWSLPGGSIEYGETIEEALAREVLEETSLVVEPGKVATIHEVIGRENDSVSHHYIILNLFAVVTGGKLEAATDADEVRWVPLSKVETYETTAGLVDRLKSAGVSAG